MDSDMFYPKEFQILIVDDVTENIQVAMNILKDMSYDFSFAKNGKQALEIAENENFDLILLDIMMPEMDGFETCIKLKKMPKFQHIPIIFLSAKNDIESISRAFEVGAVDYVSKPFHAEELKARVKTHLYLRKQQLIMIEQAKLASAGELMRNIAHQWRQPLNAIGLNMQNIWLAYEHEELDNEFLEITMERTNHLLDSMSSMIDNFAKYFKPEKAKSKFLVKDIMGEIFEIYEELFNENEIKIEFDCNKTLEAYGYPKGYKQVIMNIFSNALEALSGASIDKRVLTIRTNRVEDSQKGSQKSVVEIWDNGGGIDENDISSIFEPYFTTSFQSEGKGLGLYISKMLIEQHMNGRLQIENRKVNIDGVEYNGTYCRVEV